MGIGVSYTGANGERKSFTAGSVNALEAAMKSVAPRSSQMRGVEAMMSQQGIVGKNAEDAKVKGGSAIVKDYRGELCLRGEEGDSLVDGKKVYGSVNGRKGYFSVNEIDPPVIGRLCGQWMNTETKPDAASFDASANHGAWSIPLSRTSAELTGDGKLRIFNFYRELRFSADGRVIGVTEESSSLIGEFKCGGTGEGVGDWCVLPKFRSDGTLESMRFGTHGLLKKYAEDTGMSVPTEIKTVETVVGYPELEELPV